MVAAGDNSYTQQQLQLRLMVDKRRLVYAECDRFMADVLFSFLITLVGAWSGAPTSPSAWGCMDSLYQSVEDMDACYFETPECQNFCSVRGVASASPTTTSNWRQRR